MWLWILGAALLVVVAIAAMQYRAAAGRHVPLSARQPARRTPAGQKPPLGHEALDMTDVLRTQRRHQGLERSTSFLGAAEEAPDLINPDGLSLPDDETYSARYHAAFQAKKKQKDQST